MRVWKSTWAATRSGSSVAAMTLGPGLARGHAPAVCKRTAAVREPSGHHAVPPNSREIARAHSATGATSSLRGKRRTHRRSISLPRSRPPRRRGAHDSRWGPRWRPRLGAAPRHHSPIRERRRRRAARSGGGGRSGWHPCSARGLRRRGRSRGSGGERAAPCRARWRESASGCPPRAREGRRRDWRRCGPRGCDPRGASRRARSPPCVLPAPAPT